MWQTKYASAVPKNLGLGLNFRPCSEGYFLSGCPLSVVTIIFWTKKLKVYQAKHTSRQEEWG